MRKVPELVAMLVIPHSYYLPQGGEGASRRRGYPGAWTCRPHGEH